MNCGVKLDEQQPITMSSLDNRVLQCRRRHPFRKSFFFITTPLCYQSIFKISMNDDFLCYASFDFTAMILFSNRTSKFIHTSIHFYERLTLWHTTGLYLFGGAVYEVHKVFNRNNIVVVFALYNHRTGSFLSYEW